MSYALGIDIGSTTNKFVLLKDGKTVYEKYERHFSQVRVKTLEMLEEVAAITGEEMLSVALSGSAGLGIAQDANLPFIQEVFATGELVKRLDPDASCVIELGGEDAKIIFFDGGTDERMNGSCAGGTGAFIDQMATLLDVDAEELDRLSLGYKRIYPIASRCGVFAKTDIQPLLNQGAAKEDIARSIYQSVVNQTIAGLARGKKIKGRVLFLGGPLSFCKGLRECFKETLKLSDEDAVFPSYSKYSVALGAAFYASKSAPSYTVEALRNQIAEAKHEKTMDTMPQLFADAQAYAAFENRHAQASVPKRDIAGYSGKAYLGIDCGSTTTKLVLISEDKSILYTYYASNLGNPVAVITEQLGVIYNLCADRIEICGCACTGYGEELIKNAFGADAGIVETIAHYTAAKHFKPNVDFILDIGGQDIKCFKIKNGAIDSIMLNEACSSGCGSFLQTFAGALGYEMNDFAKMAVKADMPVDLGSRCTVFMNSSVKQAQKDGASIGNISAGLSISVVKNALYKVIRCANTDSLGKNIVVQGGTFLNNSVLRAFEQEIGRDVIRPHISGLMGAYGAALYGMNKCNKNGTSKIANANDLKSFTHEVKVLQCNGCNNHCRLTVNTFDNGRKFIAGNRCEKPLNLPKSSVHHDLYEYKNQLLMKYRTNNIIPGRPTIGIPMALNMYELLPFWHTMFDSLGFNVVVSPVSNRQLYLDGQQTIPSDTVCFPAKLVHGHIDALTKTEVDAIFYPCMSYNLDEGLGDNHYNCPVVAYYPIVIDANVKKIKEKVFIDDFVGIHMPKSFYKNFRKTLAKYGYNFSTSAIKKAADKSYKEYAAHMNAIREKADEYLQIARSENKPVIVLAGRPYHIDPEVNHSINKMICNLGAIVLTEDSISWHEKKFPTNVLNQWTYHSRLYAAAKYVSKNRDKDLNINLVQLVSFGCGVDAVTTDEARSIIESSGKIYTQIKIDEVSNMGAIKIRLRSLFSAAGIV